MLATTLSYVVYVTAAVWYVAPWLGRHAPARALLPLLWVHLWLFVVATLVDLGNDTIAGIREQLFATAVGTTWMILIFYVPALWVTLALIAWQTWEFTRPQRASSTVPARTD